MANRTTLLRYVTTDLTKATNDINNWGGAVTIRLSNTVLVASMPENFDAKNLNNNSSAVPPNTLDDTSRAMAAHWQATLDAGLLTRRLQQPNRRISMQRGLGAVALVIESDIVKPVVPLVLAGAHLLARRYAPEGVSSKVTLVFKQYNVSSTVIPGSGPPTVPSQVGAPQALAVPSARISSWPSAVTFNNKVYCFYRGSGTNTRSLFYSELSGGSWSAPQQVPNTVTSAVGPSAVVFRNKLYCFNQASESKFEVWYSSFDGSKWDAPAQVPGTRMKEGPSVVVLNDKLYCFHQGLTNPTNALWYNVFDGAKWEGDKQVIGTLITGSPSVVVFNNLLYCFYQGSGSNAKVLMVRALTPSTGVWSEAKPVPSSTRMTLGPSAVVAGGMLYCFHQSESDGKLYANVSVDGMDWGQDTLVEDAALCEGLSAATVVNNDLYYFYQKGAAGQVTNGEMWYRKLQLATASGTSVDWLNAQGEPSLKELKYDEGYKGYIKLAADVQAEFAANYGYVVYVTKSALLFTAYADEVRMCLQYKDPSSIHVSFAKMFAAQGTYDQRLVNDSPNYPPRPVSQVVPRYTLAWSRDWSYVLSNATLILLYRADNPSQNPHLWILFLDKRNSRWVEMEGPRITLRSDEVLNGAPAPQFGPSSKLFVFYHVDTANQEMRYNVLGGVNSAGEKIWGVEKVMHDTRASKTPSAVTVGQYVHVFHVGPDGGEEFRLTSLDTEVNIWTDDPVAYRLWSGGAPSAVHFLGHIYVFHKGLGAHNDAKIAFSVWDKDTLEWQKATNNAPSTNYVYGEPTAVVLGEYVYVFYSSDGLSLWYNRFDGVNWRGATRVNMAFRDVYPMEGSLTAYGWDDKIHCFFRNQTNNSMLLYKVMNTVDLTWTNEVVLPTAAGLYSKAGVILNHLLVGA